MASSQNLGQALYTYCVLLSIIQKFERPPRHWTPLFSHLEEGQEVAVLMVL